MAEARSHRDDPAFTTGDKGRGVVRAQARQGTLVRLPATRGPVLTSRDLDMLGWIGRHGVVTADQVARRFFDRAGGPVGHGAAYRRLRKLRELDLLRSDRTFYMEPSVLRLTPKGAHLADVGVGPARLVLAEIHHSLALVDLIEALLVQNPGATIVTEREHRIERRGEMAEGRRRPGVGRLPDGVLTVRGKRVALELDRTSKRSNDLERILRTYLTESYDAVWWYVRARVVPRLEAIVDRNRAGDLVSVRPLPAPPSASGEGR